VPPVLGLYTVLNPGTGIFAVDGGEVKVLVSCAGLRESFLELSKGIGACDDIKGLYKPKDSVGYIYMSKELKPRTDHPPDILLGDFTELIADEQSKKLIGEASRIGAG